MRKKILLITDHFPPEISGGVGRTFSLYKYLPNYGFDVIVLTKNSYGTLDDEKNIVRTDAFTDWKKGKYFSFKSMLKILLFPLFRYILAYSDIWWLIKSRSKVKEILFKNHFDFIYSSFPSIDSFILGLYISKKGKIPLISEFRDGLVFESVINHSNTLQRFFLRRIEKLVVFNSNAIITISPPLTNYLQQKYKAQNVRTIYNGFDPDDFIHIHHKNPALINNSTKTRIAYFGNLNASRSSDRENLFIALTKLKSSGCISSENFKISIFGKLTNEEIKLVNHWNLSDVIDLHLPILKSEGFQIISNDYDFLLLYGVSGLTSGERSKLLEYLKLQKPILGICKGNEAENIITNTKAGVVCDFDVASIENLFFKAINRDISYDPDLTEISRFDRKHQTMILAEFLKNLMVARRDNQPTV